MTPTDQQPSPEAMKAANEIFPILMSEVGYSRVSRIIDAAFANLRQEHADLRDMLEALTQYGWTIRRGACSVSSKWFWETPSGSEFEVAGSWDELPPWPDAARKALDKQRNARKEQRS
jgi:hypothetical protein